MQIHIEAIGAREVELKFEHFPEQARHAFLQRITSLTAQLLARVQSSEPENTGKLRSETVSQIYDGKDGVVGSVTLAKGLSATEYGKAGALEYGAPGPRNRNMVKSHTAQLSRVYGRLVAPMSVVISAHTRHLNVAEHKFLRGPLESMSGQVLQELEQALAEATEAA